MGKSRVEVTFGSRDILEIAVDGEELDISPIRGKQIQEYFQPFGGHAPWRGLVEEIKAFLQDTEAELDFSVHGPEASKQMFLECLKREGITFGEKASEAELAKERLSEARRAENLGNEQEAVKGYQTAAQLGNAEAQYELARRYAEGNGVEQNPWKAAEFYCKAAENGHVGAMLSAGLCYANGNGVEQDWTKAAVWYRKAAEAGNEEAQNRLSDIQNNSVKINKPKVDKKDKKSENRVDADTQQRLALDYHYGEGVANDIDETVKRYRKAAEQGDASAQYNLGHCYYAGNGVEQNEEEAVKWWRKAAEGGNADAQFGLGVYFEYKMVNTGEAFKLYQRAAEQGHKLAISKLESKRLSSSQPLRKKPGFFSRLFGR